MRNRTLKLYNLRISKSERYPRITDIETPRKYEPRDSDPKGRQQRPVVPRGWAETGELDG